MALDRGPDVAIRAGLVSTQCKGVPIVWQRGLWTAISSLIIKVPDRELNVRGVTVSR